MSWPIGSVWWCEGSLVRIVSEADVQWNVEVEYIGSGRRFMFAAEDLGETRRMHQAKVEVWRRFDTREEAEAWAKSVGLDALDHHATFREVWV